MSVVNLVKDPEPPQLEFRPIDSLTVYAKNSRTHSRTQIEQIARSIDSFGFTNAVLADDEGIVAGHGRVEGAKLLLKMGKVLRLPNGAKIPDGMVPVVDVSGWTPEQRRAYIIADNQLALNAGWDEDLLREEILALQDDGFDLELLGFSDQQLHDLLLVEPDLGGDKDPDDAPDLPDAPHSVPGDVWVMGPHRVMCGSSLSVTDWDKLMAGERADIVWTDPPYNVDIGGKNAALDRADKGNRGKTGAIMNDKMGDAEFYQFLLDMYSSVLMQMKAGAPIYVAHADSEGINFRKAFIDAGFKLSSCIIWNKNVHVLGHLDFQPKHEPILYGWKPGASHRWYGGRKNTSVIELGDSGPFTRLPDGRWQIKVGDSVMVVSGDAQVEEHPSSVIFEAKPAKSDLHPTMKPVALVERMLRLSARTGDIVLDAFGGSGTTLIAADRMGMCGRLMELDPKYVDVIVQRWQKFTGRRAVHAETGAEFPVAPDA